MLNFLFLLHRNSSPDSVASERAEMRSPGPSVTARDLAKTLVPLIRCDANDMRETIISGLGHINPVALRWGSLLYTVHKILNQQVYVKSNCQLMNQEKNYME